MYSTPSIINVVVPFKTGFPSSSMTFTVTFILSDGLPLTGSAEIVVFTLLLLPSKFVLLVILVLILLFTLILIFLAVLVLT